MCSRVRTLVITLFQEIRLPHDRYHRPVRMRMTYICRPGIVPMACFPHGHFIIYNSYFQSLSVLRSGWSRSQIWSLPAVIHRRSCNSSKLLTRGFRLIEKPGIVFNITRESPEQQRLANSFNCDLPSIHSGRRCLAEWMAISPFSLAILLLSCRFTKEGEKE
jgi:hypothetical protein